MGRKIETYIYMWDYSCYYIYWYISLSIVLYQYKDSVPWHCPMTNNCYFRLQVRWRTRSWGRPSRGQAVSTPTSCTRSAAARGVSAHWSPSSTTGWEPLLLVWRRCMWRHTGTWSRPMSCWCHFLIILLIYSYYTLNFVGFFSSHFLFYYALKSPKSLNPGLRATPRSGSLSCGRWCSAWWRCRWARTSWNRSTPRASTRQSCPWNSSPC